MVFGSIIPRQTQAKRQDLFQVQYTKHGDGFICKAHTAIDLDCGDICEVWAPITAGVVLIHA